MIVEAIYENGVLRPLTPLTLSEGQHVWLSLVTVEPPDAQHVASILAEIAALPATGGGSPLTSRDHDRYLYGPMEQS
jgi:predicted DNA-binding antitoxin AbrB/MazE fold protein